MVAEWYSGCSGILRERDRVAPVESIGRAVLLEWHRKRCSEGALIWGYFECGMRYLVKIAPIKGIKVIGHDFVALWSVARWWSHTWSSDVERQNEYHERKRNL
ncbi:hypothetical protein KCP73_08865 [Salmonella enterica subsp. enterica]|nr:hypothetical protein KCP73_08865 [Salmonella enterica subsp. enterica]